MPRRSALAAFAAAVLMLSVRFSSAEDRPFPSRDVRVRVSLESDGRAAVSEEYALTAPIDGASFQLLEHPCAIVSSVSGSIDDRPVAFDADAGVHRPWTGLRVDASGAASGGRVLALRYDVSTRGSEVVLPIVMPAATLELADGSRGARVKFALRWTGALGAARVAMPRLEPSSSSGEWEAQLLAMPSSVRVDLAPGVGRGTCDRAIDGQTGGLEWRFLVFAGTMVVWVPVYLVWFGRRWRPTS